MARGSRDERMLAAIARVLDRDEEIVERGRCWAARRRDRVPLLVLGRRQYDAVLTDRRLMLFTRRRRRRLRPDDVALVKRLGALALDAERERLVLLQQRIRTDTGLALVLEWPWRTRRMGHTLAAALSHRAAA